MNTATTTTTASSPSIISDKPKLKTPCKGCDTMTTSVLYGLALCHGCIKIYLCEWRKLVERNQEFFTIKNKCLILEKLIADLNESNNCLQKTPIWDFKKYCERKFKCRWCKFRKLIKLVQHLPTPRYDKPLHDKLAYFYSLKESIFRKINELFEHGDVMDRRPEETTHYHKSCFILNQISNKSEFGSYEETEFYRSVVANIKQGYFSEKCNGIQQKSAKTRVDCPNKKITNIISEKDKMELKQQEARKEKRKRELQDRIDKLCNIREIEPLAKIKKSCSDAGSSSEEISEPYFKFSESAKCMNVIGQVEVCCDSQNDESIDKNNHHKYEPTENTTIKTAFPNQTSLQPSDFVIPKLIQQTLQANTNNQSKQILNLSQNTKLTFQKRNISELVTNLNLTYQTQLLKPSPEKQIYNQIVRIFVDLHQDEKDKAPYLTDLFIPENLPDITKLDNNKNEVIPINLYHYDIFDHISLTNLASWPEEILASKLHDLRVKDSYHVPVNTFNLNYDYLNSQYDPDESADDRKKNTYEQQFIQIPFDHRSKTKTTTTTFNSFLGEPVTQFRKLANNNFWRIQFTIKDLLLTKIYELIPCARQIYDLIDAKTDGQNNIATVICSGVVNNCREFSNADIFRFIKLSNEVRGKTHILQTMTGYDAKQKCFFLYSSTKYFTLDSLKTFYFTKLGIEKGTLFIDQLIKYSEIMVRQPKILIIMINFICGLREFYQYAEILAKYLKVLCPEIIDHYQKNYEKCMIEIIEFCWRQGLDYVECIAEHYGMKEFIGELDEFLVKANKLRLFYLYDKNQEDTLM